MVNTMSIKDRYLMCLISISLYEKSNEEKDKIYLDILYDMKKEIEQEAKNSGVSLEGIE